MNSQQALAAEVRAQVAARNLAVGDVAEHVGISTTSYWRYFTAGPKARPPSWPIVVLVAEALGMTAAELTALAEQRMGDSARSDGWESLDEETQIELAQTARNVRTARRDREGKPH